MEKMIGRGGVHCSKCVSYICKKRNGDEPRKQLAEE